MGRGRPSKEGWMMTSSRAFLQVGAGRALVEGHSGCKLAGRNVCYIHILEHDDDSMMRPYEVL